MAPGRLPRSAAAAALLILASALAGAMPTPARAGSPAAAAVAAPPDVDVASYLVVDYDSGRILAAKNPHEQLRPASTLKILTADTLIPRLSASATISPQPADYAAEPDGSLVGITTGVTYSVADLWHAAFLVSGNDAIMTLAHMAGGVGYTISLMQAEAAKLGARDTVVVDPDGYDADGQVTSAYDLALMARAGLRMSAFRRYCGVTQAEFPEPKGQMKLLVSHDPMLLHYPGMIGIKGGITSLAGHTYVGAATRGGHTIIITLMLGGTDIWDQATKLLDWGFAADGRVTPIGTLGSGGLVAAPSPTPTPTPSPTATTATPTPTSAHTSPTPAFSAEATLPTTDDPTTTLPATKSVAATRPTIVRSPAWLPAALAAVLLALLPIGLDLRWRLKTR